MYIYIDESVSFHTAVQTAPVNGCMYIYMGVYALVSLLSVNAYVYVLVCLLS